MDDNNTNEDEPNLMGYKESVLKFTGELQWYFVQEDNENTPLQKLAICSNFVEP